MTRRLIPLLLLVASASACASRSAMSRADADGRKLRLQLAQAYVAKGSYDAALPLVKQSVEELPRNAYVHVLYASVLRERGLYPQAEKEYRIALRLAPRLAAAHAGLGILYDLTKRTKEALAEHQASLDLAPRNASYWNNLGFSRLIAGENEAAIPAFEKALSLDPSIVVAYNNLGFAYGRLGRYDDALRAFRAAVGDAGAYVNLALIYDEAGDADSAARYRTLAYHLVPELERRP